MTYETTKTGAQVDALLDGAVQQQQTYPDDGLGKTFFERIVGGLTDVSPFNLKYVQSISGGHALLQDDVKNRVALYGYLKSDGSQGPLCSWIAHEPAFQGGGAGTNIWGELHCPEVVGRDGVHIRLMSSYWDYGNNSHTGGIVNSGIGFRYHELWFQRHSTGYVTASIDTQTGGANFIDSWIRIFSQPGEGTYRAIYFGNPSGGAVALIDNDDANPNLFQFGPFSWNRSAGPWGEPTIGTGSHTFQVRHLHLYNAGGNVQGFARGDHTSHTFAKTDVHGNIFGGIRNDGALSVPELTDVAAVNNSVYRGADGHLRYKRTDGSVSVINADVPVLVSALPSASDANSPRRMFVSDATATTFHSVVAGGGANLVPVWRDGTNWRIG